MASKNRRVLLLVSLVAVGCANPSVPEGLSREGESEIEYWHQVNEDGFGNPDNYYAWSMAVFKGRLYAGTNNVTWEEPYMSDGLEVWRTGDGLQWEPAAAGGFGNPSNVGTRNMIAFKDHLYLGTLNLSPGTELWRTEDGLSWEKVVSEGFGYPEENIALRGMAVFRDELYVGTTRSVGTQVWASRDGKAWAQVNRDGFGDPYLGEVSTLHVFQGALYAGAGGIFGAQLWRTRDGRNWERVVNQWGQGMFWDPLNLTVFSMTDWQGRLYVGTFNLLTGGEIWRTPDGTHWDQVNADGFGSPFTHYIWSLAPYRDPYDGAEYLYAGTIRFHIIGWSGEGFDLWRTRDGLHWTQEVGDGFGNPLNYGARTLLSFQDRLYLGTATNVFEPGRGCEVWRMNRPCPDEDGDRFAACWCRGPDPDDSDPSVVPENARRPRRAKSSERSGAHD